MKVRIKATEEFTNCESFPVKAERLYVTICGAVFQRGDEPTLNSHQWRDPSYTENTESSSPLAGLRSGTDLRKHRNGSQTGPWEEPRGLFQLVRCSRVGPV